MTTPNLEALLATGDGRSSGLSPAAKAEKKRRATKASGLARAALARLHPDDHRNLYKQALELVDAEAGPLPGDEKQAP